MISERTLRQWRKDALNEPRVIGFAVMENDNITTSMTVIHTLNERILRLTQELIDLYLIRKG